MHDSFRLEDQRGRCDPAYGVETTEDLVRFRKGLAGSPNLFPNEGDSTTREPMHQHYILRATMDPLTPSARY
jgi:hypothetical protein